MSPSCSQTLTENIWNVFLFEMKKHRFFRQGYRDGSKNRLNSHYLKPQSHYRHKLGVIVYCFEQGMVDDFAIDRNEQRVTAWLKGKVVYTYTGKPRT